MSLSAVRSRRWVCALLVGLAAAAGCSSGSQAGVVPSSPVAVDRQARTLPEPDGVAFWNRHDGLLVETITTSSCLSGSSTCPGGRIELTTDGGRTWRTVDRVPFPLRAVAVAPGGAAWVETGRCGAASPDACTSALLLVSADGGVRWREVHSDEPVASVSPLSATAAWAVPPGPRVGRLVYTDDGGRRWQARPSPCTQFHALGTWAVDFPTPRHGWVLCTSEPATDMQVKTLYHTADAGVSWQLQAAAGLDAVDAKAPPGTGVLDIIGYFPSLDLTDTAYGWMWTYGPGLFATRTDGRAWTQIATKVVNYNTNSVAAGSVLREGHGFLLIRTHSYAATFELLLTTDGGRRWKTLRAWPSLVPSNAT